jgi:hypothetical protein
MEPSIRPFTICWEKMTTPSISRPALHPSRRSEHQFADHGRMRHFAAEGQEAVKIVARSRQERRSTLTHQRTTTSTFFVRVAIIPASAHSAALSVDNGSCSTVFT